MITKMQRTRNPTVCCTKKSQDHMVLAWSFKKLLQAWGLTYFDFFSSLAFLFSLMDLAGFFLTSFLTSLDLAITDLPCE